MIGKLPQVGQVSVYAQFLCYDNAMHMQSLLPAVPRQEGNASANVYRRLSVTTWPSIVADIPKAQKARTSWLFEGAGDDSWSAWVHTYTFELARKAATVANKISITRAEECGARNTDSLAAK